MSDIAADPQPALDAGAAVKAAVQLAPGLVVPAAWVPYLLALAGGVALGGGAGTGLTMGLGADQVRTIVVEELHQHEVREGQQLEAMEQRLGVEIREAILDERERRSAP